MKPRGTAGAEQLATSEHRERLGSSRIGRIHLRKIETSKRIVAPEASSDRCSAPRRDSIVAQIESRQATTLAGP